MEIRQLKSFLFTARLLSFNQAARRLNYAQSSVSAQIQALEEEMDVRLFDRLGRRIKLTEAGERLLVYAEKIIDLTDEIQDEVVKGREPRGSLTIRIPETFGVHRLPIVIKEFRSRFPEIRLNFITCAHEGLQEDLRKGVTDLAFLLTESVQAVDLEVEALGVESLVMVAHPDHPLVLKPAVKTHEIAKETIMLSKVDCSYRRTFQQIIEQEDLQLKRLIEFNSIEAIKRCVMAGIGITILPEVAVTTEIAQGGLAILPWIEGKIEVAILMIRYRNKWISPTLNAFMSTVREYLNV